MEGERRLGALVPVRRLGAEPVAAATGGEVVERSLQAVAPQEPLEGADRPATVTGIARDGVGSQFGLDESRHVERLLVTAAVRGLARSPAPVPGDADVRLLALTHVSQRYLGSELEREAREVFARTVAPRDFDVIDVPFSEGGEPTLIKAGARPEREPRTAPTLEPAAES